MSFAYRGWRLYSWTVALSPGLEKTVYFFSKDVPLKGKKANLPAGYGVAIGPKTGVPILTKIDGKGASVPEKTLRP